MMSNISIIFLGEYRPTHSRIMLHKK